jgi:hypothetical protein
MLTTGWISWYKSRRCELLRLAYARHIMICEQLRRSPRRSEQNSVVQCTLLTLHLPLLSRRECKDGLTFGMDGDHCDRHSGSLVDRTDGIGKMTEEIRRWRTTTRIFGVWTYARIFGRRAHGSLALEWISLLGESNGTLW